MNSTYATVIVTDVNKQPAQSDMGEGFFTTPLSSTGELPATHWMSSGWFLNEELDRICNIGEGAFSWPYQISFGDDWQATLDYLGLQLVQEPETPENVDA